MVAWVGGLGKQGQIFEIAFPMSSGMLRWGDCFGPNVVHTATCSLPTHWETEFADGWILQNRDTRDMTY
jgi:hypothetical protein